MQAELAVLAADYSSVHIGHNTGHNTLPMLLHSAPEIYWDLH